MLDASNYPAGNGGFLGPAQSTLFADGPSPARKTLYPHQARAIEMLRASLGRGNRRVVVQGPTGFGKTLCAAKIIEGAAAKGNGVIFTAPAVSLIDQTVRALEREGVTGIGVMQANHPRTDRSAQIQVASVQTLARREIPKAAIVIVDEAHIHARVIDELMAERPDVVFVGLSATPWRKGMGLHWQDLVIPCTPEELIAAGFLSQFAVYAPDVPDLSGVKVRAGEYAEDALAELMGEAKLVGNVVENWLARGEGRPTLLFAVNRAHAASLHREFHAAGVAAAYVDGETDSVERGIIGKQFDRGEIAVICSVRTMTTGVDLSVSCIVDCAPTRSEMLHCLDAETEILTSKGWRGIGEVAVGDCVASCVGPDQSAGQWAMVKGAIRRPMQPEERWVSYDSVHTNFRVTGQHRMIFGTGKRPLRYGVAEEMATYTDGVKMPSAVTIRQPGVPLSADELWFIGMMMTDGTWGSSQGYIYQSERHPEILARIESTLQRLGIGYRKSPVAPPKAGEVRELHRRWRFNMSIGMPKSKVGVGRFAPHPESVRVDGATGFRHLLPYLDKDLALPLLAMSREQFAALLQGIWDGDGSKKLGADYTPATKHIVTVRPLLADRLQALGAINGIMVNLRPVDAPGRARMYHLSFKEQDWRHVGGTGRSTAFEVSPATAEDVWCVETTTGNIVTRRRGKVTVMGNCQKIGRGLRINPGTEDCVIFDHAGNSLRLGLVTDIHHATLCKRKPGEREVDRKPAAEKLPKPCPKCEVLFTGKLCPACGHERQPPRVDAAEGELVEITGRKPKSTMADKQLFWSMSLWIDRERGKGGKLAKALYRGKFDVWPKGLNDTPTPPNQAFLNYERSRRIAFVKSKGRAA